jgi:hypothetical protein
MSAIHVPGSTTQLVDRMTALVTQLRSATSGGFTTSEGLGRGQKAAELLAKESRLAVAHFRQIGAEAKREARERARAA